jgi:hypothetical protein
MVEYGDRKDQGSKPAQAKSKQDSISINKPGVLVHNYDPNYTGGL